MTTTLPPQNSNVTDSDLTIFATMLLASCMSLVCTLFVMLTAISHHEMRVVVLCCVIIFLMLYISVMTGIKIGNTIQTRI